MTLRANFRWKNPDSTADLNQRQAYLVQKGVIWGGTIQPGIGLTVNVTPSVAESFDGMTVTEDANQVPNLLAGQSNIIVLHAKYNAGGSPAQPTLNWHVYEESVYNAHPNKAEFIRYGKVVLAGGAGAVTWADIYTTERDEVTPVGRDWFRGKVAAVVNLPTPPPHTNREGDFYYVEAVNTFYFWDGLAWVPQTSGAFNLEVVDMNRVAIQTERDRIVNGSGVLGGVRPSTSSSPNASNSLVSTIDFPSDDSVVGVDSFSALVNGFFIETYAQKVQLAAAGDRYDLIFLEVWRETVADPDNFAYERNIDGSTTYTLPQASTVLEGLTWTHGTGGNNFSLNEIATDDHTSVVTKYRLAPVSNVTTLALYSPFDTAVASLATNVDGNPFAIIPITGTEMDKRLWYAASTTSSDGISWAIPLLVVRRLATENHATANGIKEFRSQVRYIFPVHAVSDTDNMAKENTQKLLQSESMPFTTTNYASKGPSGFITSNRQDIIFGAGNTYRLFVNGPIKVRIRGVEEWIEFPTLSETLPSPPVVSYERNLVYLKMNATLYADDPTLTNYMVSEVHRPYFPSITAAGFKRGYIQWTLVNVNLGATSALDEDDAMAADGWSRGDVYLAGTGQEYDDGGIYSRNIAVDADDRIHPYGVEWAIPVMLVHRLNTSGWTTANPNGSHAIRPDGRIFASSAHSFDTVDLRHMVDVSEDELNAMLESDIDKLMKGTLRTRMAEKWAGGGTGGAVAGSRILQSDTIGVDAATFNLSTPDGNKRIWSDGREFQLIAKSFDLTSNAGGALDVFQYTAGIAPGAGALTIRAPAGAQLVRHLPAVLMADADDGNATYKDFLSAPLWSTQRVFGTAYPNAAVAKYIDATNQEQDFAWFTDEAFTVNVVDPDTGKALEMSMKTAAATAGDVATLAWWVHYDRSPDAASPFVGNYGLAEIPDTVWKLTQGPTTGAPVPVNLGVPYTVVRKNVAPAAATVTISIANVQAVSSVDGNVDKLIGFDVASIATDVAAGITFSSAQMSEARDSITLTFTAPFSGDVEVAVFYETDTVTEWVEVGRGGKSVRAYFGWHEESIDLGFPMVPAPYAFTTGDNVWQDVEADGLNVSMPFVWTRASVFPGTPWDLVSTLSNPSLVGYKYSNLVSFVDPTPYVSQYMLAIVPVHRAPTSAVSDFLQIDYTYTPYQGVSSTGGAVAVAATATTKLKGMLHGTVESNSDFYASQSGACSYFGGVDSWSGWPARVSSPVNNFSSSRFLTYNNTGLVKSTATRGVRGLNFSAQEKESMYAAALLRLPFAGNPAMSFSPASAYPNVPMDFHLDPGREGASCGYFSYAPGYPGLLAGAAVVEHQFFNALSPLAIRGDSRQKNRIRFLHASDYLAGSVLTGITYDSAARAAIEIASGNMLTADATIGEVAGNIVGLLSTYFPSASTTEIQVTSGIRIGNQGESTYSFLPNSGTFFPEHYLIGAPENTFPAVALSTDKVFFCVCGGTTLQFMANNYPDYHLLSHVGFLNDGLAGDKYLYNSVVIEDTRRTPFSSHGEIGGLTYGLMKSEYPDLIRIPFSSAGSPSGSYYRETSIASASGFTSLKGYSLGYPVSWGVVTTNAVESLIQPSVLYHAAYGRGVYLGSTSKAYIMPAFVPGTGTSLGEVLRTANVLPEVTAQAPSSLPSYPHEPVFSSSNRRNYPVDKGGPLAYVFYGALVNPSSDAYSGRAVLQISGGTTRVEESFIALGGSSLSLESEGLDSTAIDAFWPSHRPVLKKK